MTHLHNIAGKELTDKRGSWLRRLRYAAACAGAERWRVHAVLAHGAWLADRGEFRTLAGNLPDLAERDLAAWLKEYAREKYGLPWTWALRLIIPVIVEILVRLISNPTD